MQRGIFPLLTLNNEKVKIKSSILIILALFIVRLLIQTQIVVPLYRLAWPNVPTGVFFTTSGDTEGYIQPWINLIEKGNYSIDGITPSAIRPPYPGLLFGISYFLTRSKIISMEITSVIQILMGCIGIYFMVLLCREICEDFFEKHRMASWAAYLYLFLSVVSFHTLFFDGAILSDGPATVFLSLFSYTYYQYLKQNDKTTYLIVAATFIALLTLYRPYYAAFYPILLFHFYYYIRKRIRDVSTLLIRISLLIVPVVLLDLPWIIRNYIRFNKFIPFQSRIYFYSSENDSTFTACVPIAARVITFSDAYYTCAAISCYFESHPDSQCPIRFPKYILGEKLNMNVIEEIKNTYIQYHSNKDSDSTLHKKLIHSLKKMYEYYKKDHPYTYWIWPRLYALKKFLIHGGTFYFPPFNKGMKVINPLLFIPLKLSQTILYWFCLTLGIFGLFYLFVAKNYASFLFLIPLFLILFFPTFMTHYESRYFFASYPALLLGAVFIVIHLTSMLKVQSILSMRIR